MQTRRRPNHRNKLKSDQPREERSSHSIRQCARRKERKQLTAEVTALDAKAAKVWHFALTLINRALSSYIFLLTVKHESNNCHLSDSLALLPMLSTLRELATMTSSFMSPKISEIWILGAIINLPYGCRVTTNADLCANYFNTAHERERLFSDNLSPFFLRFYRRDVHSAPAYESTASMPRRTTAAALSKPAAETKPFCQPWSM